MSLSVCPWQAFPTKSNVCEQDHRVKHLSASLTHKHQTKLENLASDKHSSLLQVLVNYGRKSFMTLGDGVNAMKLFSS